LKIKQYLKLSFLKSGAFLTFFLNGDSGGGGVSVIEKTMIYSGSG